MRRLLASLTLLTACGDRTPARIEVAEREVTINTRFARAIGARLVNERGEVLSRSHLTYSASPPTILSTRGDSITCLKDGTASVSIAGGGKATGVNVRCHLVTSFGWESVSLYVGDDSKPLAFAAYDTMGRQVPNLRLPVVVEDTTVVRLVNGQLVPQKVGRTFITTHAGPKVTGRVSVSVGDLVDERKFSLDAGATLSWPLQPGQYGLDLETADTRSQLVVAWAGTHCGVARPGSERHLLCLVRPEATSPMLHVRNMDAAPARGTIRLARGAAP